MLGKTYLNKVSPTLKKPVLHTLDPMSFFTVLLTGFDLSWSEEFQVFHRICCKHFDFVWNNKGDVWWSEFAAFEVLKSGQEVERVSCSHVCEAARRTSCLCFWEPNVSGRFLPITLYLSVNSLGKVHWCGGRSRTTDPSSAGIFCVEPEISHVVYSRFTNPQFRLMLQRHSFKVTVVPSCINLKSAGASAHSHVL